MNNMKVTFKRITNPTSQDFGFATISQVSRINKMLKDIYDNRLRMIIRTHIAKLNENHWVLWFEIPSENRASIFYDVVIEMKRENHENSFLQADIKLWSNDPNFKFSYTYVLNKAGQIPDFLISKCSIRALNEAPEIRNPYSIWHLEKYIIFAKYHLLSKGYLNPKYLEEDYDRNLTVQDIENRVMHQDDKQKQLSNKNIKESSIVEDIQKI